MTQHDSQRVSLVVPRADAEAQIRRQVDQGRRLLTRQIPNHEAFEQATAEMHKWSDRNRELLRRIAVLDELASGYGRVGYVLTGSITWADRLLRLQRVVRTRISDLESVLGRLDLIPEAQELVSAPLQPDATRIEAARRVFVVHGHDDAAKEAVARFVDRLGLHAVILHEQANRGRTIIEKVENHGQGVSYVVVLLTPDDEGRPTGEPGSALPRVRQNVVFEFGFFVGALGRDRVCALHKGDIDLPSDLSGILWVPMDDQGAWQLSLARELKEAGLSVDLNTLVS